MKICNSSTPVKNTFTCYDACPPIVVDTWVQSEQQRRIERWLTRSWKQQKSSGNATASCWQIRIHSTVWAQLPTMSSSWLEALLRMLSSASANSKWCLNSILNEHVSAAWSCTALKHCFCEACDLSLDYQIHGHIYLVLLRRPQSKPRRGARSEEKPGSLMQHLINVHKT